MLPQASDQQRIMALRHETEGGSPSAGAAAPPRGILRTGTSRSGEEGNGLSHTARLVLKLCLKLKLCFETAFCPAKHASSAVMQVPAIHHMNRGGKGSRFLRFMIIIVRPIAGNAVDMCVIVSGSGNNLVGAHWLPPCYADVFVSRVYRLAQRPPACPLVCPLVIRTFLD